MNMRKSYSSAAPQIMLFVYLLLPDLQYTILEMIKMYGKYYIVLLITGRGN